mgnify:FL=1
MYLTRLLNVYSSSNFQKSSLEKIWTRQYALVKNGEAPQQTIDFDEQMNTNAALDLDENFYGDQDYDMEDFDPEGFDINEGSGNPYDEDKY